MEMVFGNVIMWIDFVRLFGQDFANRLLISIHNNFKNATVRLKITDR